MTKNITLSLLLLIGAFVSFFWLSSVFSAGDSAFYAGVQRDLNDRFVTASVLFGITKLVAGILSFLQTIQVEAGVVLAGVKISPMEVLAPVTNTIDKLSNLFLFAMGAIILQKVLMLVSGWFCFKLAVPISALLGVFHLWTGHRALRNAAIVLAGLSIAVWAVVPVSAKVSTMVEKHFLSGMLEEAQTGIEFNKDSISGIQSELDEENRVTFSGKVRLVINDTLDYAKAMIADLINALIVVFTTVLVIPIATVFILWLIARWLIRQIV